ncbi:MAG TPA: hypothetical protein V6C99_00265 [Oculatellaceae cyanobacterium]|jgi:lipoate-protein ligase A
MRLFFLQSGFQNGLYNMALDEALLEWVRAEQQPIFVVRTYRWSQATLSLGVNQPVSDIPTLIQRYQQQGQTVEAVVRRPTGGRAILHGNDISFALITNNPPLLRQSLKDSYATLSSLVEQALQALGIATMPISTTTSRDYLRSPLCFETRTPSDLLTPSGQKLSGSAQLRRAGGILQHGAAFLEHYGISEPVFAAQLFEVTTTTLQAPLQPFPLNDIQEPLHALQKRYAASAEELASAVASRQPAPIL